MHVRDLVAGDDQTNPFRLEYGLLGLTNDLADVYEVCIGCYRQVDPMAHLGSGNDKHVAMCHGIDAHETDTGLVAPHECAGNVAFDDSGEESRHNPR